MAMKPSARRTPKNCTACNVLYTPTGNASKFCPECAEFRALWMRRKHNETARILRGSKVGVGSGGQNEGSCHDQKYRQWFLMDVYSRQDGQCIDCWKDLTPRQMLLHHIDHNRNNNVLSNFTGVCKRCHQIEHRCWEAFRKV